MQAGPISSTDRISDVIRRSSRTTSVFYEYGIDFCCGGSQKLEDVCKEKNIILTNLLADLQKALSHEHSPLETHPGADSAGVHPEVANLPLPDLIDHIYQYHHAFLYANLPRISRLFEKVCKAHGTKHPYVLEARNVFNTLYEELMQHLRKEEVEIFPGLEFGDFTASEVQSLEHEHHSAGSTLDLLRRTMKSYQAPDGACPTFRLLCEKLIKMEANIFQHISEEQSLLMPSFMPK
ncbi:hypothetical protein RCL1_001936 [Eukaryota sp. TZLM3-RCL]